MDFIELIFAIAVLGVFGWILMQLPMPAAFRNVIYALMVLGIIAYLFQMLAGGVPHLGFHR